VTWKRTNEQEANNGYSRLNETEKRKVDIVKLTINGREIIAKKGVTVLEAALDAGIYIPTLCYDPDLKPYGGCRLCVVEIEGMRALASACTTPTTDGMVVHTETPRVNQSRRITMELIIANHHGDCLACVKNQQCELLKIAQYLGMERDHIDRLRKDTQVLPIDASHPLFIRDLNKCILCAKCVRACHEVVCHDAIDIAFRGNSARIATFGDKPIIESICKSCGECVARCPTGALVPKYEKAPAKEIRTICPYCGVGCSLYLGVRDNRIVSVRGARDGSVNRGSLCVKGRWGYDFINHPERLTTPLIKKNGELKEASWDEALELVAKKLRRYAPHEVGVVTSAKCTNEENYVMQKFARAVLGTNNIDHCARLCHAPSVAGLVQSFGSGAMTNSIDEVDGAACIFAIGTNTTVSHPVIGSRVKRAVQNGARLIVANPIEIDLCRFADLWLRLRPGTDVALLMGMMRVIVDEKLFDSSFIEQRCQDFDVFKDSLSNFDLDFVEQVTGVPSKEIAEAGRIYATSKPATIMFYAMGITQHSHGTDNVLATANLAMLTGNVGKPCTGVNPLRGQNNVQGACDMGALPNVYPGYQAVADPAVREKFETAWGCSLPPSLRDKFGITWACSLPLSPGLTLVEILEAAYRKEIKALYLVGENPALSDPDAQHVREALTRLEFFVVQDIFLSETAKFAHVVLPAASFAEKDGTFTNTERRVQRVRKAIEPIGDSKPDWWIICQVAQRLGARGFDYSQPSDIMEEISNLTPSYGGISYQRLETGGLQWPCPSDDHPGTPILHMNSFVRGKGRFIPLKYVPPGELADKEYPLILTTGRSLYHFHTGTMTRKVAGLNILEPEGVVEISPKDASQLGIVQGDKVKISSRRGEITAKAKVTEALPSGLVFMTFHFAESAANILTNPKLDPISKIPEFKVSAVKVQKL
jgi:formate dehydrogenase alpha subunit